MVDALELIESEGDRMVVVATRDPGRPVPQYPGWTMSDLLSHTGSIMGRTTIVCRESRQERPETPRLPDGGNAVDWFEDQLRELVAVLAEAEPDTKVWGFGSTPSVRFWMRRTLIEVGVHRFDAEAAWGDPDSLLDLVAIAGLEEFGEMWLPRLGNVATIRLLATDFGRTWLLGDGEPEAQVTGTASDVYLRLMSRPSPVVLPEAWATAVEGLSPPPL